MLKRAACTLYLAQETDTLGKDSELASTLAQGKPVIAYVPKVVSVEAHARKIANEPLGFLWKRSLLLEAEEIFVDSACAQELEHAMPVVSGKRRKSVLDWKDELFGFLRRRVSHRTFNVIQEEDDEIKRSLGDKFKQMCKTVAVGEKHYFEKRANTLRISHPLAIQVHLETGVANGVLVVRNAEDCAKLIEGILTKNLSFKVVHPEGMTELREELSGCPYRVVTDDAKLTNSFWNFYLTGRTFKG